MNWFLDVFAEDCASDTSAALSSIRRLQEQNGLSDPCEDDCEVFAPYIDILPDESDHEGGSPLDFRDKSRR